MTGPAHAPQTELVTLPTLADFLAAPPADLQPYVPASLVYAAAGTRRSAALAGLRTADDEYASWSRSRMIEVLQMMYDHHVQHIFTIPATPGQFAEVGPYRSSLLRWIEWGVAGDDALAEYAALGWRVRLVSFGAPELADAERRLATLPAANCSTARTLWYIVAADSGAIWQRLLTAAAESGALNRAEAARALYGEAPPDIELFVGFGKPVVAPELLPPLLHDKVNCYWTQRPGYRMTAGEFRTILYDHAITRATWQADKHDRAQAALAHRDEWEQGPILGLGKRLGPYWYPQPPAGAGRACESTN